MKKLLLIILIILNGCASGPLSHLKCNENEAIVIGYVDLYYNGEDITYTSEIKLSNAISMNRDERLYTFKDSKFIIARLPLGNYHLTGVNCLPPNAIDKKVKKINPKHTRLELKKSKLYYIGHLKFYWQGWEYDRQEEFNRKSWETWGLIATLIVNMLNEEKKNRQYGKENVRLVVNNKWNDILPDLKVTYPELGVVTPNLLTLNYPKQKD